MQVAAGAPQIIDNLCPECNGHFKSVLEFLDELEIPYVLNSNLVRGLDYYTRTVFEIWAEGDDNDSCQTALGGGGRYDGLIGLLGGDETPAVGFSFGVERVAEKVMKLNLDLEPKISKDVFLVQLGDLARRKVMKAFDKIIDTNISVGESVGRGSIKSQLRMANKVHAKLALIIGQKEALDNTVIVRDMKSGMQETVIMDDIVKEVRRMLSK
jgi:histidyl-tRNA synthetase